MRQPIDRIFTYSTLGTVYTNISTPTDLVNHAVSELVQAKIGAAEAAFEGPPAPPLPFPIGRHAETLHDVVVVALARVNELMKDTQLLMAANKVLFAGGELDYIWKERSFFTTLDQLHIGIGNPRVLPETPAARLATLPADEQRFLAKLTVALWNAVGVVLWRDDLFEVRTYTSSAIAYGRVPAVVAESRIRAFSLPSVVRPPGQRILFGTVFKYVEDAARAIAQHCASASSLCYFTGRIVDLCITALKLGDPKMPRASFEPLLSSANFVTTTTARGDMVPLEASVLAGMVTEIMAAMRSCPNVEELTVADYANRFNCKRIYAARGKAVVATIITRRVTETTTPTSLIDVIDFPGVGAIRAEPASTLLTTGAYDQTHAALLKVVDDELVSEAMSLLSEGDTRRVLLSTAPVSDLTALAVCLAGSVEYDSPHGNPMETHHVNYLVTVDTEQTGWENLAVTFVDGRAITTKWENVLRMTRAYEGSRDYAVSAGLAAIASRPGGATILAASPNNKLLEAGKELEMTVTYPVYEYTREEGTRVIDIAQSPDTISVAPMRLLGMAPFKSHKIVASEASRLVLRDKARLFCAIKDIIDNASMPEYIFVSHVDSAEPMYRADGAGAAKRAAAIAQTDLMYTDAIVRFLSSAPIKIAHAEAIVRARRSAHTPTTHFERVAYLQTVMQYLDRFVTRVFAVPPEFVEIVRRIEQTAMFMRHALYTIGREGL
jgi:hypothetical protein